MAQTARVAPVFTPCGPPPLQEATPRADIVSVRCPVCDNELGRLLLDMGLFEAVAGYRTHVPRGDWSGTIRKRRPTPPHGTPDLQRFIAAGGVDIRLTLDQLRECAQTFECDEDHASTVGHEVLASAMVVAMRAAAMIASAGR